MIFALPHSREGICILCMFAIHFVRTTRRSHRGASKASKQQEINDLEILMTSIPEILRGLFPAKICNFKKKAETLRGNCNLTSWCTHWGIIIFFSRFFLETKRFLLTNHISKIILFSLKVHVSLIKLLFLYNALKCLWTLRNIILTQKRLHQL